MSKVTIISNMGYRFGYPHYTDLAELLARNGSDVEIVMPETSDIAEWNKNRGYQFHFIKEPAIHIPGFRNIRFLALAGWRSRHAQSLMISLQPSLLIGLIFNLILRRRVAYYLVELITFGKDHGGAYSLLQRLLPFTSIRNFTTGKCRSRAFRRAVGLRKTPEVLPLSALLQTRSILTRKGPTLAELVRETTGQPEALIVALNGALSEVNCLDLLLDAEIPASSGVLIGLVGTLVEPWKSKVAEARKKTGNYIYVGELNGNRYDLIDFLKGSDIGLVIKRYDHEQTANDRLYTPNKLYDFIAAGTPTICSRQKSMSFIPAEGLGYQLPDLDVATLKQSLISLAENRGELNLMKSRVADKFQTTYNLEIAAKEIVQFLG